MKIYLAGSCSIEQRTMMKQIAEKLRSRVNTEVYCPFELKIENAWDLPQEEWARRVFDEDTRAIREADVIVLVSPGRESTAGTNWEQGFAYALNKKIIVFQITNKPTSLMTFCGCTLFYNVENERHMFNLLENALSDQNTFKGFCETVLT